MLGVSMDDTAQVWDGTTKIQLGEPPADGEWKGLLYSAIFSPDAQRVLTVNDGAAQLWDTATGKLLTVMKSRERVLPQTSEGCHDRGICTQTAASISEYLMMAQ